MIYKNLYDEFYQYSDLRPSDNNNVSLKYPPENLNFKSVEKWADWELFEHKITKERNWVKVSDILIRGLEDCFYDPIYTSILDPRNV